MKEIKQYLKGEDVRHSLANTPQITFEVTDACNLNCRYCGYGDLYSDYDERRGIMLQEKIAKALLEYLHDLWISPENISYKREIYVSFYGGEPLLIFRLFPHYIQLYAMDCGPMCLRMIAKYYGKTYTLQTLRDRCFFSEWADITQSHYVIP